MDKVTYLTALQDGWANCQGCALCRERTQTVFGYGNPDAQIMIVGEAPGENEDKAGLPFVGHAGILLDQFLANISDRDDVVHEFQQVIAIKGNSQAVEDVRNEHRIRLRELLLQDYYITNIVMCRPPENRDPTPKEIEACQVRLREQIYTVDPVLIMALGRFALMALVGKKLSITSVRGQIFDVPFEGRGMPVTYPVLALLHPSYLLRINDFNSKGGESAKTYNAMLKAVTLVDHFNFQHYGIPIPKRPDPEKS